MPETKNNNEYLLYLDGLRAIAIVAVLIFHNDNAWLQGGFLGVEVFFVISGFIITKLLLDHWNRTGSMDFRHFLLRRFRRLLPGIVTMVLMVWVCVLFLFPDELTQIREDLPYDLTFTSNWAYIFNERSYFESIGRPRIFEHLWSLGIEFQFYLIWPFLCLALFRWQGWVSRIGLFCAVLLSTWWMVHLYQPGQDPSRVYFGTDTRAGALLLGGLVALMVNQPKWLPAWGKYYAVNSINLIGIIGVIFFLINAKSTDNYLFQGGFLCVSILTAIVIGTCFLTYKQGRSSMNLRVLGSKPFRAIGIRAYGIYIWHWPVFCLTLPWVDVPFDGIYLFIFRLALTGCLSEVTYRFIEMPIANGFIENTIGTFMSSTGLRRKRIIVSWVLISITGLVGISSLVMATEKILESTQASPIEGDVFNANTIEYPVKSALGDSGVVGETDSSRIKLSLGNQTSIIANQDAKQKESTLLPSGVSPKFSKNVPLSDIERKSDLGADASIARVCDDKNSQLKNPDQNRLKLDRNSKGWVTRLQTVDNAAHKPPVFVLGDSVMVGAAPELMLQLPCISIDAKVGRQLAEGIDILTERKNNGLISDTVIIHLGNNGPIDEKQIDNLLKLLSGIKNIIFVNLKLPRNYQNANNRLLKDAAIKNSQVKVIDWQNNSLDATKVGQKIFGKDGIHLTGVGAKLYADLIMGEIYLAARQLSSSPKK